MACLGSRQTSMMKLVYVKIINGFWILSIFELKFYDLDVFTVRDDTHMTFMKIV